MKNFLLLLALFLALPFAIFILPFLFISSMSAEINQASAQCAGSASGGLETVSVDPSSVPTEPIAGWDHEQLVNAAHVIQAGQDLGLDGRDQTIGVMVAMGESSLIVIDYGDAAGPDSRGLFQQRDNGAWGTYEERMDPYLSATNFFTAMMRIENRRSLSPTEVGHRTQRNQDPDHYTATWDDAVVVVERLAGIDLGLSDTQTGACPAAGAGVDVPEGDWIRPHNGPGTSAFGMRRHPVRGDWSFHSGTDIGAPCGDSQLATQSGTVIASGWDGGAYGYRIEIDHGGGIISTYSHAPSGGLLVAVGDTVEAGQPVALVGTTGLSTGCHVHWEIYVNGEPTDPLAFLENPPNAGPSVPTA